MYNFLEDPNESKNNDEEMKLEFEKTKDDGLKDEKIQDDTQEDEINILESEIKNKKNSSILYNGPFEESVNMTEIQNKTAKTNMDSPIDKIHLEDFKIGKNYLFTKEATEIIIENYDDLVIKNEFVNYLIENLSEYYMIDDFEYINEFLFPNEQNSLTSDLIKTILHQKRSLLFNYYVEQVFLVVDEVTKDFNFIEGVIYVLKVNASLVPSDLKPFCDEHLKKYLSLLSIEELENYYKLVSEKFSQLKNQNFEKDFYKSYFLTAMKQKIKDEPIETLHKLKKVCNLILKYPELKYNRQARILFTTYNLLNAKNNYYTYDDDIMYDVQSYIEEILMNDQILDYNLIYFVSYFDGKIDYKKSLNLLINILEGVKTISLSKTKFELIKEQTIDESLQFIEWVLINHHRDTNNEEFKIAIKDFISFNWKFFNDNNKYLIKLKSSLRNYSKLDEVLQEVEQEQEKGFKIWLQKHGAFSVSIGLTVLFFAITCFLGVTFLNSYLSSITSTFVLIAIILLEIVIAGFLVLIMVFENNKN